jgi:hypothetical protein
MLWVKSTSKIVVLKFNANFGTQSRFLHKTLNPLPKKIKLKNKIFLEFLKNGHKCPPCPLQVLNTNYLMVKKIWVLRKYSHIAHTRKMYLNF